MARRIVHQPLAGLLSAMRSTAGVSAALTVRGVRHRYGSQVALDGVDLMVRAGGFAGLIYRRPRG